MEKLKQKSNDAIESIVVRSTRWIGSTSSILVHTALFFVAFLLYFWGVQIDKILLVVTTLVSLEAIYLSIFIQMSVNRQSSRLHEVAQDVEDIQENVEEIQEDVEGIEKDVEGIQEDVEEIQEEQEEEENDQKQEEVTLSHIQIILSQLAQDVKELKDKQK